MAKMLNRCKPCGNPVLEGQKWVPVGHGRLEHLLCATQLRQEVVKREGKGTGTAERTRRIVQEARSPAPSVGPAHRKNSFGQAALQGVRRVARFFSSRSRRAA